jgi:hypothetical protein
LAGKIAGIAISAKLEPLAKTKPLNQVRWHEDIGGMGGKVMNRIAQEAVTLGGVDFQDTGYRQKVCRNRQCRSGNDVCFGIYQRSAFNRRELLGEARFWGEAESGLSLISGKTSGLVLGIASKGISITATGATPARTIVGTTRLAVPLGTISLRSVPLGAGSLGGAVSLRTKVVIALLGMTLGTKCLMRIGETALHWGVSIRRGVSVRIVSAAVSWRAALEVTRSLIAEIRISSGTGTISPVSATRVAIITPAWLSTLISLLGVATLLRVPALLWIALLGVATLLRIAALGPFDLATLELRRGRRLAGQIRLGGWKILG